MRIDKETESGKTGVCDECTSGVKEEVMKEPNFEVNMNEYLPLQGRGIQYAETGDSAGRAEAGRTADGDPACRTSWESAGRRSGKQSVNLELEGLVSDDPEKGSRGGGDYGKEVCGMCWKCASALEELCCEACM